MMKLFSVVGLLAVAVAWPAFSEQNQEPIRKAVFGPGQQDVHIREICKFAGKANPKTLVFETAEGDAESEIAARVKSFEAAGARPEPIRMHKAKVDPVVVRKKIMEADIIWFGCGVAEWLLDKIDFYYLEDAIKAAYRNGTVLCGNSAGSLIQAYGGYNDFSDGRYDFMRGLGIIRSYFVPHYQAEQFRKGFEERLALETDPATPDVAWAVENGAGVFFVNEKPEVRRVVGKGESPEAKAYRFVRKDGKWTRSVVPAANGPAVPEPRVSVDYAWGARRLTVRNERADGVLSGVTAAWSYAIDGRVFGSGEFDLGEMTSGASHTETLGLPNYSKWSPVGWGEKFLTVRLLKDGREFRRVQFRPSGEHALYPRLPRCHTYGEWTTADADGDTRCRHGETEAVLAGKDGLPKALSRKGRVLLAGPSEAAGGVAVRTELLRDGALRLVFGGGQPISRSPVLASFVLAKELTSVTWYGLGPNDDPEATVDVWKSSDVRHHAGVRWLELVGAGAKLRITATEPLYAASFGFRLVDEGEGRRLVLDAAAPCALVFDPYDQADELLVTKPYVQDVGTSGGTVALVTTREEPSLRLEWKGGKVPFAFSRFGPADVWLATARVEGLGPGTQVDFEVAGERGTFRTWKDDGKGFKCGIFGDFQCGVARTDWELDPMLCGERMFVDMARNERCDFAVGTGDVSDMGDYGKEINPLVLERQFSVLGTMIPSFMAFGNHDSRFPQNCFFYVNPKSGDPDVKSFAFWRDNCLFVCLDNAETGIDQSPAKPATLKWLERLLRSEAAQKAKFRFVFQHTPMFEEEFGNCDRCAIDLFADCNVDCVFSGDHHGYARLERGGVRQVVNGCFGYFDHGEPESALHCNWYGSETLVGGHSLALSDRTWRFQKPGRPGELGPATPVNHGLHAGYGTLEVRGDTAVYRQLGFNADGSKVGLFDTFTMKAGVRPPKRRGLAMERYAYDKSDWHLAYVLTGKDGAVLELEEKGAKVLRFRRPDATGALVPASVKAGFDTAKGVDGTLWRSEPIVDEKAETVGVRFEHRKTKAKVTYLLKPGNEVEVKGNGV